MTISPFIIYLFGVTDDIIAACVFLIVTCFIAFVFHTIPCFTEDKQSYWDFYKKTARFAYLPIIIIGLLGATFIPSSKTVAMMVVIPAIVNSEPIQKDLPELYKIGVEALKESLVSKKEMEAAK